MAFQFRVAVFSIRELAEKRFIPDHAREDFRYVLKIFRRLLPKMWVSNQFELEDFASPNSITGVVVLSPFVCGDQTFLRHAFDAFRKLGFQGEILVFVPPQRITRYPHSNHSWVFATDDLSDIIDKIREHCMVQTK